jgi:hypothetical protein
LAPEHRRDWLFSSSGIVIAGENGAQEGEARRVFTIELTRGPSWQTPAETIDHNECETDSIAAAVAEAKHWLMQSRVQAPARGATHYRVMGETGAVVGGPP